MRVLYTSDLHGSESLYAQLEQSLSDRRPDLLILGGDLFPDCNGPSPAVDQAAYVRERFMPRIAVWRNAVPGLQVACISGNHDWLAAWDVLQAEHERGTLCLLQHTRLCPIGGVSFLGYSRTPPTPFHVKDFERLDVPGAPAPRGAALTWNRALQRVVEVDLQDYFETAGTIEADLAQAAATEPGFIFVCHAPPHASRLDRLQTVPEPTGSVAVRRFITQRAPSVTLHGHIHESPRISGSYTDEIGSTLCINPGQEHARLCYVTFDTDDARGTLRHAVLP